MAKLLAELRSFLCQAELARDAPLAIAIFWLGNPDTVVEGEALESRVIGEVEGIKRLDKGCVI
jgi:hypothetical protein